MRFNWFDRLGDWNPQLLREIKGRLKPRNLLIGAAISLLGQFFVFKSYQTLLPTVTPGLLDPVPNKYCTDISSSYSLPSCLIDSLGNV